jgi:hypothetical protein
MGRILDQLGGSGTRPNGCTTFIPTRREGKRNRNKVTAEEEIEGKQREKVGEKTERNRER